MVAAHQSHWLGEEGETQKQVTPGEVSSSFLTLSLLLLQSLDCSIIHLSPASASSGRVQNVSKSIASAATIVSNSFSAFGCLSWLGRLTGHSSSPSVEHSVTLCVAEKTCPRVHKALMGLPATYHLSSPLCHFNPLNSSLPQTKSIFFFFKKRISCVC